MVFLQQCKDNMSEDNATVLGNIVGLLAKMNLAAEQVSDPRTRATIDVVKRVMFLPVLLRFLVGRADVRASAVIFQRYEMRSRRDSIEAHTCTRHPWVIHRCTISEGHNVFELID
jgi:hypothetical protein